MAKFDPLTAYLHMQKASVVRLTFVQLQTIVGILPSTAVRDRTWWANRADGNHLQAKGWLNAGFEIKTVVLGDYVEFAKKAPAKPKADVEPNEESA